jgi:hypothetical protein
VAPTPANAAIPIIATDVFSLEFLMGIICSFHRTFVVWT